MDILFKPRVEATEQMAQNCMDISLSKNQRERKITSKWHVQSLYVDVFLVSILFYARKPKLRELKRRIFFCLIFSISKECHKMYFWKYMKEMSQAIVFAELTLDIDRKILN